MGIWARSFEREEPDQPALWHDWNVMLWPVRTIDGKWTIGNVLRRRWNGRWEFKDRPETLDEQLDRMASP